MFKYKPRKQRFKVLYGGKKHSYGSANLGIRVTDGQLCSPSYEKTVEPVSDNFTYHEYTNMFDCEGKEICEDDVVNFTEEPWIHGVVRYYESKGAWMCGHRRLNKYMAKRLKIVGNVFNYE